MSWSLYPSALYTLREGLQAGVPAVRRADRGMHLLPALAVALDPTMLEFEARALGGFGDETNLDFAGARGVGLELPLQVYVPAEHDPVGRFVGQDPGPARL